MKTTILATAAALAAAAVLGCATTGDIPVSLDSDEPVYISPANQDGVQDTVTLEVDAQPLERTRLTAFQVAVRDAGGTPVYTRELDAEEVGPRMTLWDGRDDEGELVDDGRYTLTVTVRDDNDNEGVAGPREVVVDNTPPFVEVSAPYTLFTPNGDDRLDVLSVYQRRSSREDEWTGEMLNEEGVPVRTFSWQGGARDFTWDGTTDAGPVARDGTYSYRVQATDRAGNTARFELAEIVLERDQRSAVVFVSRPSFSPNDDGRADTIQIRPRAAFVENIETWRVEIRDITGEVVREFVRRGEPSPVIFDGTDSNGEVVPDGTYSAALTIFYRGGQTPQATSSPFTVDTAPPRATVRLSSAAFSPDGDGSRDTVQILQTSSEEREWRGVLAAPDGTEVVARTWNGRVSDFEWDGTDAQGRLLPDGVYTYTLSAEDEAGNQSGPISTRLRLDTSDVPVSIVAAAAGFSPNGDGEQDVLEFGMQARLAEEIDRWSVSLLSASGRELGLVATGTALPESVTWDGVVNRRPVADGEYVARLEVWYRKGNVSVGRTGTIRLDTHPPDLTTSVTPEVFSPDDDGTDDTLTISISASDLSPIARWQAHVYDPEGSLFTSWSGSGQPRTIRWDGRSTYGELVQSAEDYRLVVRATDSAGNTAGDEVIIPVGILVIREDERLRIRVSSIYFLPYTDDYTSLESEQAARNIETIDRLVEVLRKYPDHTIRIEGHAVQVLWDDPQRAREEQEDVLLPLSLARAEAIKRALVERGIASSRLTTTGYGGARPVAPHDDLENRWKNRRVEFVLEQPQE